MTSANHPCNLKPLSPFVPANDRDITPNQQTGRDCLAAHDCCVAQFMTTAIMTEPSPRPPLALPHEFYLGHAPTLRLLGGTTAGATSYLSVTASPLPLVAHRQRTAYFHMADEPCTELPNPEAAVLPALVSVFDSEVTSLGPMMTRSAWVCAAFRQAILS
jgi:hypothetical protein